LLSEDPYEILAKKLDSSVPRLSPAGRKGNIPKGWLDYLRVLIEPEDVKFLVKLNVSPKSMTLSRFSKRIKKSQDKALRIIERLIDQDCVWKSGTKEPKYSINLTPLLHNLPTIRYFEFPEEKAKKLAELSYKNFVEEKWYKTYSGSPETQTFRVIPVQKSLKTQTLIMPYDEVEKIIDNARYICLAKCMCKTRTEFMGVRECKNKYPLETCMPLNQGAKYYIERGLGREISKKEAKELCKEFNKMGLIHTTENFSDDRHTLLCNCCPCCCNPLGGITKWDKPNSVAAANYIAEVKSPKECERCETCVEKCIFKAIILNEGGPEINNERCMGCGVCVVNCPSGVIDLKRIEKEKTPRSFLELGLKIGREMD